MCWAQPHNVHSHSWYLSLCNNKTSNWIILTTVKLGGGGGDALEKSGSVRAPCALLAQVKSRGERTRLSLTYREFRGCSTLTTVAEEPALWSLSSLRHLHGEAQRLTWERQPLNGTARWVSHNSSHVIFKTALGKETFIEAFTGFNMFRSCFVVELRGGKK